MICLECHRGVLARHRDSILCLRCGHGYHPAILVIAAIRGERIERVSFWRRLGAWFRRLG